MFLGDLSITYSLNFRLGIKNGKGLFIAPSVYFAKNKSDVLVKIYFILLRFRFLYSTVACC
jgi:hypothetical protein